MKKQVSFFFFLKTQPLVALALWVTLGSVRADSGPDHQAAQNQPIELGSSGGNVNDRSALFCCSGTLGALVEDSTGAQYILSNNHVLARANKANIGDDVNHPGQIDQACGQQGAVADLSDFVRIRFAKGRKVPANDVDAAIAVVRTGAVRSDGSILDIGTLSADTVAAFMGQAVQKSGRTTGHTVGSVAAVGVTVDIGYPKQCGSEAVNVARFVNQIRITPGTFSAGGDSGAVITEDVASNPRTVGLLFAGSGSSTLANHIDDVLNALGVSMVGGTPPPVVCGDGNCDAGESPCDCPADCGNPPATETNCADGVDNDCDGSIDCADGDCAGDPACPAGGNNAIVDCITYTTTGGKNRDKHLNITVSIVDDNDNPVAVAAVSVTVTSDAGFSGSATATTDGNGNAGFSVKNAQSALYMTDVTDVVASGLSFDGTEPPNEFLKGTDPTPDVDCRSGSSSSTSSNGPGHSGAAMANARNVKARHSERLFGIPDVVGHGIGLSEGGRPIIEVYLENDNASSRRQIPADLENVQVRIVVTGPFVAF